MKVNTAVLNLQISTDLRERTRVVASRLRKTSSDVARDALSEKVEALEFKFRQEEAQREAEKAAKKAKQFPQRVPLRPFGTPLITQIRTSGVISSSTQDPMDALYEQHAKDVLAASNNEEKHERVAAAIAAVRRERPLTAPEKDEPILRILETHIKRLREDSYEPLRTVDDFVGTVLDVSKLKTSGVTE
jgi:predicted transcriptional regulator